MSEHKNKKGNGEGQMKEEAKTKAPSAQADNGREAIAAATGDVKIEVSAQEYEGLKARVQELQPRSKAR